MKSNLELFDQLTSLTTEGRNKRTSKIDSLGTTEILRLINSEDRKVPGAVGKAIPEISRAVELVVRALRRGGRLIYVGAGTSGRLGILDASECPPTFGTSPKTIRGIIAGGKKAVFRSQEGAEDKAARGRGEIKALKLTTNDVVCGIAASLRTPYVIAAVQEARRLGAKTLYLTTNPRSKFNEPQFLQLRRSVDVAICVPVGPEVIMGSTRMKAGTAQKLVLNMITTASMIRLGKVYENMMVDLRMTSRKLEERAKRVLMIATGVNYSTAVKVLTRANGHVKTALVMIKAGVDAPEARSLLQRSDGFVRNALENRQPRTMKKCR